VVPELLPCLRHFNIAFYAYHPIAAGLLSGKYKFGEEVKEEEFRFSGKVNKKKRLQFDHHFVLLSDLLIQEWIFFVLDWFRKNVSDSYLIGCIVPGDQLLTPPRVLFLAPRTKWVPSLRSTTLLPFRFRARYWNQLTFEGIEILEKAAEKNQITLIDASLRWMRHHSGLESKDGIIIGASSLNHLDENLKALNQGPLPESMVQAFDEAWEKVKPTCQYYVRDAVARFPISRTQLIMGETKDEEAAKETTQ